MAPCSGPFFRLQVLRRPQPEELETIPATLRIVEQPHGQTGLLRFAPSLRLPGFYRPRPVRVTVGLFDVLPALQTRVRLQRISFGNPDAWLARNCVLASCYCH